MPPRPTTDTRKSMMEIPAFQILFHHFLDDRPPEAKFLLVLFVVDANKRFQVILDHGVQGRRGGFLEW